MISINNLVKSYGHQEVLHGINLHLEQGQCVAFVGPNGCGKTTLLKCILGLVTPQHGEIKVNGLKVQSSSEYRKCIGFMPQNSCFPSNMTVRQIFDTLLDIRNNPVDIDRELYEAYHIDEMLDKRAGTLSGGMSQKVNAALAFLFNPDILVLDEPTASLDLLASAVLKNKIKKEKGKLIFVTSHILSELNDIATHVVFMNEGRVLFFKSVDQLLEESRKDDLTQAVMNYLTQDR